MKIERARGTRSKTSKASRRQEITKIRAELKETDTKNPSKKSINTGAGFWKISTKENTSQINKKRENDQIDAIKNNKEDLTTDSSEIQTIIGDC